MSGNGRATLVVVLIGVIAAVAGLMVLRSNKSESQPTSPASGVESARASAAAVLVRDESHRLQEAPDGKVTVVEFLDFECEACLSAYPTVEQIRADYAGRITYVVRYFPIASHPNAQLAAQTAQAAAQQGRFEEMYTTLFDKAADWSHQESSQAALFRSYATGIGLDMTQFELDWNSAAVVDRVNRDSADGTALGVSGTPTFFVNGAPVVVESSWNDLRTAIDAALAE